MATKDSRLKTLKEYLPLIYIFLVCFGYFSKSLYYDKFGIDILYYLSIQELVLMFIPAGSAIVAAILFLIIVSSPWLVFRADDEEDLESEIKKDKHNIYRLIDKIKNQKLQKISRKTYWILAIITIIYLDYVPMLLFLFFVITKNLEYTMLTSKLVVVLMIIWGILFMLKFRFQNSKSKFNPRMQLFVYFILLIVMFIVYADITLNKADKIISGEPEYHVKFTIDEQLIETNKQLLFFGQTNDYLFFRKVNSKENYIYNKNDIKEFVIKEIEL
ncbi:hypothetical protein [Flagellimonas sp. 2504JD4-2]